MSEKKGESDNTMVTIGGVVEILHNHLTQALCDNVFTQERTTERERQWSLYNLVRFWIAVILEAPASLTRALEEARCGRGSELFPVVEATPEAFFQRCRKLKDAFFSSVYETFIGSLMPEAPSTYCEELSGLMKRFTAVWIIDGSRLAKIAHRLKILWNVKEAVLPGCLIACYDLFRGIAPVVRVSPDAAESEHRRGEEVLDVVPKGALVAGDRLFCTIRFFRKLAENGLHGVFRRNRLLNVKKVGPTPGRRKGRGRPKDDLVEIGSGVRYPKIVVRRIKVPGLELFTDVLDPSQLSAEEALLLYRYRWQVERLFYDLKEVLNLNRLYTGSPRSVTMQVYATALLHAAMRVAQARVAEEAGLKPEALSPKKLFPLLAAASIQRVIAELCFDVVCRKNRRVKLAEPDWATELPSSRIRLSAILVEQRKGKRRKRPYHPRRRRWLSFIKVRGGRKLT